MGAYGLYFTLTAAFFAVGAWALAVSASTDHATRVSATLFALLTGALAVWLGGVGATLLADVLRPGPSLIIDRQGVYDRRQGLRLAWSEVRTAEIRHGARMVQLAFSTASGRVVRGAPFRIGGWPGRGDDAVISLMFLAPPPNISALAMTALIEDAGGVVWRRIPWLPGSQPPPSVARSCRDKALGAAKGATLAAAAVACVYYLNRDADRLAMRDLPRIRAAVSEAGFPDATIKPAFVNCSGRDRGYRWVSSAGYGTACPNYRGAVRVQVDHRDRP